MKFKRNQCLTLTAPLNEGEVVKYIKKTCPGNPSPRPFYITVERSCGHRMTIDYRHTEEGNQEFED